MTISVIPAQVLKPSKILISKVKNSSELFLQAFDAKGKLIKLSDVSEIKIQGIENLSWENFGSGFILKFNTISQSSDFSVEIGSSIHQFNWKELSEIDLKRNPAFHN